MCCVVSTCVHNRATDSVVTSKSQNCISFYTNHFFCHERLGAFFFVLADIRLRGLGTRRCDSVKHNGQAGNATSIADDTRSLVSLVIFLQFSGCYSDSSDMRSV